MTGTGGLYLLYAYIFVSFLLVSSHAKDEYQHFTCHGREYSTSVVNSQHRLLCLFCTVVCQSISKQQVDRSPIAAGTCVRWPGLMQLGL